MLSTAPMYANIPAVDLDRARKFYRETLGLKEVKSDGEWTAVFEAGQGTRIHLYKRGPSKADHTVAGFIVEDLGAEMKSLRSRGVVFEEYDMPGLKTENGVATWGNEKASWFKDSEGNILCVGQYA